MQRRDFLAGAAMGLTGLAAGIGMQQTARAADSRPNIVLFVADDAGWRDFGFHGSEIHTPNLDRLAETGVELEHFYVDPVCSPTRCSLMTGRPPSRLGITGPLQIWHDEALPPDTVTVAELLRRAGYDTCISGKWHLGMRPHQYPGHFGFRHSYGYVGPWIDSYTHYTTNFRGEGEATRQWHRNGELINEFGEHVTDLITREAVEFITTLRHPDRPFFLYVPYSAPHTPIQEPIEYLAFYEDTIENESRRYFAAAMTHMDDGIGQVVRALDNAGLRENTMVMFFSDNGGARGGNYQETWLKPPASFYMSYGSTDTLSDNRPLRGFKGSLYEGGIRVAALMNWPGRLSAGKTDETLCVRDVYPTFAALAGADIPVSTLIEGIDAWPVLNGGASTDDRIVYWRQGNSTAVRRGSWKLIHTGETIPDGRIELYNIAGDPFETTDRASEEPDLVAELTTELVRQHGMDGRIIY